MDYGNQRAVNQQMSCSDNGNQSIVDNDTDVKSCGMQMINLLDLNNDCLEEIFRRIESLDDLVNIFEVCKRFQEPVANAFTFKMKRNSISLENTSMYCRLKTVRTLHAFSSRLQKVRIQFGKEKNDHFFNFIIEKCGFGLTEVFLNNEICKSFQFLNMENIFRLNSNSPNLRSLTFHYISPSFIDPKCIEQNFPTLEHLSLNSEGFTNLNLQNFIKLNPQLKSLAVRHDNGLRISTQLLEFMDENMSQLERLTLQIMVRQKVPASVSYQPLHLQHLKELNIYSYPCAFYFPIETYLPVLAISNENVETMNFRLDTCNSQLIDIVCQYKKLTKLSLFVRTSCDGIDDTHLLQIARGLPYLSELKYICVNEITADGIIEFVRISRQLTRLILRRASRNPRYKLEDFKNKLDSAEWNIAIDGPVMKVSTKSIKKLRKK